MLNNPLIILYLLIKKSIEFPYKKKQNLEERIKLVFVVDLEICRLLTTEDIKIRHVPYFWKFYLGFPRNNYLTKSDKEKGPSQETSCCFSVLSHIFAMNRTKSNRTKQEGDSLHLFQPPNLPPFS